MEKGLKRVDQMGSIQPYLEVRPGLLKGVKLNEKMRKNLWKIFDYVREIISAELAEYSREGGEESTGLRLHFEKGQEIDLPEDVNERFERVKSEERSPSAVAVLIMAISPVSSPFSHANCLTRGSIAFVQLSIGDLINPPRDLNGISGRILHELLHSLLVPHMRSGVMDDGRIPERRREGGECPLIRCMGNMEAVILTHHPIMIDIERVTDESPMIATRPDASTVVLSASAIYCVIVRSTVAERFIDWRGNEEMERRISKLKEDDHLIVCSQFNVKCFIPNSIQIIS